MREANREGAAAEKRGEKNKFLICEKHEVPCSLMLNDTQKSLFQKSHCKIVASFELRNFLWNLLVCPAQRRSVATFNIVAIIHYFVNIRAFAVQITRIVLCIADFSRILLLRRFVLLRARLA